MVRADHWNDVYAERGVDGVSWYQPVPEPSLALLDALGVAPSEPVVDAGGGASRLAAELVRRGFVDVTVVDVSAEALEAT